MTHTDQIQTFARNWASIWNTIIKRVGKWGGILAGLVAGLVLVELFVMLPFLAWLWLEFGTLKENVDPPTWVWVTVGFWIIFWLTVVVAAARTRRENNTETNDK